MSRRILVVDDDLVTTQTLHRALMAEGFLVETENDSMRALETAIRFQPDFVILDFLMPRAHGGDVAWQLASTAALRKTPRIILCSGVPTAEFALKLPPIKIEILEKPVDFATLVKLLRVPDV